MHRNGAIQVSAYISSIGWRQSRTGGTEMVISGKDKMASLMTAHHPLLKFNSGMNLASVPSAVLLRSATARVISSSAQENWVMSKNIQESKHAGLILDRQAEATLKSFNIHQLRPYPTGRLPIRSQGIQRLGLWLWLSLMVRTS